MFFRFRALARSASCLQKQRQCSDGKHVHSHGPIVNTVEVLRDWFEFDSKLVGCWSWKPWLEVGVFTFWLAHLDVPLA